jgi:anti-sigma B factor antagonist
VNPTSKGFPTLMVARVANGARVKITGRACFTHSVDFKTLITELRKRGTSHFELDLTDCATMDSTFLGVLAGLAMNGGPESKECEDLELINPNPRVADLLDNLGIAHLFRVVTCTDRHDLPMEECQSANASKQELCGASLEAHNLLMKIHPSNVEKFREVTEFLAEDLRKITPDSEQKA